MLKVGDTVYRINLNTKIIDKLKVKEIVHYGDSFEFNLRSEDPIYESNKYHKYYTYNQEEAEEKMKRHALVFPTKEEARDFINKNIEDLKKQLLIYGDLFILRIHD